MKGGFIDYATPIIVFVYVYVLPSLLTFFLLVAIRINYFRLVFFNKTCIEYYLFSGRKLEISSLTKYRSKLVCSLAVRLEVMSPCRTITVVSRLVRSQLNKDKETRVSSHPRSTRQGSRLRSNSSSIRIRKSTIKYVLYEIRVKNFNLPGFKNLKTMKFELFQTKARKKQRIYRKSTKNPRISPKNSKKFFLKMLELVKKSENE